MGNPPDGPHAKGRLIALAALALSASIPLATMAEAAQRTTPASRTAKAKTSHCSPGGICKTTPAKTRKRGVGIPGRPYR